MQVTYINPFSIKSNKYSNYKLHNSSPAFRAGYLGDIFINRELPIDKLKQFTLEEYHNLSQSEKLSINKMIDSIIQNRSWQDVQNAFCFDNAHHIFNNYKTSWRMFNEYLTDHKIVTTDLKNSLEKKYGTGNFVVISIGRSVSSICQCLGYIIGQENVIQIPMSNARRFRHPQNLLKIEQDTIDNLTDYLESKGMSKEAVQTSGKKYVFTDYSNSGSTMAGIKKLFKSDRIFGETNNIQFIDIMKILPFKYRFSWLSYALAQMDYKDLSVVNRCENLSETSKSVYKPEDWDLLLKSFYFKFMDNEINAI